MSKSTHKFALTWGIVFVFFMLAALTPGVLAKSAKKHGNAPRPSSPAATAAKKKQPGPPPAAFVENIATSTMDLYRYGNNYYGGIAYSWQGPVVLPTTYIHWTIDRNIILGGDFRTAFPVQSECPPIAQVCEPGFAYRFTIDLGEWCDGQEHTFSALRRDGDEQGRVNLTDQGLGGGGPYQSKFQCFGGGGSPDLPMKDALIFIPGVAGSQLHEMNPDGSPGENLWPDGLKEPVHPEKLHKLSLNPDNPPDPNNPSNPYTPVVPGEILGKIEFLGINYFTKYFYEPILDYLEEEGYPNQSTGCSFGGPRPDMFIFTYDWRMTNYESAQQLKALVDCVYTKYPGRKVNIVTHSMGGLIARRYVLLNPHGHNVNKLITTVAPWLGTPKAIDAVFTGRFLPLDAYPDRIFDIAQFSRAVHELMPSRSYFTIGGRPVAYRGFWSSTSLSYSLFDYDETYRLINAEIPFAPYLNSDLFHIDPQDDWHNDDNPIEVYNFYGMQRCDETIERVKITPTAVYYVSGLTSQSKFDVEREFSIGDKTVPRLSAARTAGMQAPNTIRNVGLIPGYLRGCKDDDLYEHNGILQNPFLRGYIKAILEGTPLPEGDSLSARSSKVPRRGTEGIGGIDIGGEEAEPKNYLDVTGVDRLDITAENGDINPSQGSIDLPVPGVDYEPGAKSHEVVMYPHTASFLISKVVDFKFTSTGEPMNIQSMKGFGRNELIQTVKYIDLNLPVGVVALLKYSSKGLANLRYDADGDGEFESEVSPDVVLEGTDGNDTTGPEVDISYTLDGDVATVTVDASDAGAGVKAVRYSVDDTNINTTYSSPFTVDVSQPRLLWVTAEDFAGNRELYVKWFDFNTPVSSSSQTPPANAAGWNTSDVTLELKGLDDIGGSGVDTLTTSASGAQPFAEEVRKRNLGIFAFPEPATADDFITKTFNVHMEGTTTFTYHSIDIKGNVETAQTYAVKIDKGLPITGHELTPGQNDTTVTLTAADLVSGVDQIFYSIDGGANQSYTAPFTVSNTGGHSVRYFARDVAGNEETPRTVFINPEDVANSVLISEFRARGLQGADDEFIELYNNGDTAVDISGWTINVKNGSNSTPVLLATINNDVVMPPRGHYLLRKDGEENYSLSGYAEADQTYTESLGDNCGIKLVSDNSVTIDAVGFAGVADSTYREGNGITPSAGITTDGQYSFARNFSVKKLPVDSNNSKNDFVFVSTDAATYNNLKSILGSPGPENLGSHVYKEGAILVGQVDNAVTLAESPNRFYNYSETDPVYPVGTISVRRRLFNNTGQTITQMRLRVTAITTKNSGVIFPTQALLKLLDTSDMTVMTANGVTEIELKGLTVDSVPNTVNGGLNSSYLIYLGSEGLAPGNAVNINLKAGIVTNGQYKLEFRFETVQ